MSSCYEESISVKIDCILHYQTNRMTKIIFTPVLILFHISVNAQLRWINMDPGFGNLPASVHVYKTTDSLDGKPNVAWYIEADLKDKSLELPPILL